MRFKLLKLTNEKTALLGLLIDLKVHILAARKSVIISGTIRTPIKAQIQATLSGSVKLITTSYFLSRSKLGIPWLQMINPVRFGLMIEVINRTNPLDRTEQARTTMKVITYAHNFNILSITSIHSELEVSSSSGGGDSTKTSHFLTVSAALL